jgi:2-polyprenyl-3-methyl-5-hydroxy-6-metoxy-1,4-benzoquinol methylase
MSNHQLVRYPEYDMTNLGFESGIFDLVIHSDTLEHVPNPERGLCRMSYNKNLAVDSHNQPHWMITANH